MYTWLKVQRERYKIKNTSTSQSLLNPNISTKWFSSTTFRKIVLCFYLMIRIWKLNWSCCKRRNCQHSHSALPCLNSSKNPILFLNHFCSPSAVCRYLVPALYVIITVRTVMSAIVQEFEHSLVLSLFGTGMKADLSQSCSHCWVF